MSWRTNNRCWGGFQLHWSCAIKRYWHQEIVVLHSSAETCNSTTPTSQPVRHGSTVALQAVYSKHDWLGCSTTTTSCVNSQCPGLYMEGQDWNTCRQNVFQIFRAQGHGDVKVGDLVGLYLTRESGKWFGCHTTACIKNICPHIASYEYGFDAPEKWYRCYGSVFKIYARGKQLGETICDRDHIMLFYLQALNWIGAYGSDHHRTCPGSTRPPPPSKYDHCGGENYEIWKKWCTIKLMTFSVSS